MAIFFIIGSIFLACRSAWGGKRFHFCASAESATPPHAAPARPLGGLVVGRSWLASLAMSAHPPTPPRSHPPLGGSPELLFLALSCLLFGCFTLPLLLADMRYFAFGENSGCTRCFPSCPIPHPPARPRFGRMVSCSSARFSRHSALPQAPLLPLPPRGAPYNYLIDRVNKMVLLNHVRPEEKSQGSLESWRPICRPAGRFGSLLSPCALKRARLRTLLA